MKDGPDIARIASLIGDPARANMLTALMGGKALTATELSQEAGITLQTASSHLKKLSDGHLLALRKQGRHRYFSLCNEEVAQVIETMMGLAAGTGHTRTRTGPRNAELRKARICYNHLAGHLGIELYRGLTARNFLKIAENGLELTGVGADFMQDFGIDLDGSRRNKSVMCRECLDWRKRRSHLTGNLGRAIMSQIGHLGWASRVPESRVIQFTRTGETQFQRWFQVKN